MKTLHFYLIRQVLATLVMTVAVFTFVLLLANGLKQILLLLINHQATLGGVLEAFALLIPWVIAFALPMGMMTASLLVFGRFSADQELTAVRSSGISLVALISPILFLSLVLCGVSAIINLEVAPRCRVAYNRLIYRMGAKMSGVVLPEGRFVTDFPNYIIYVAHNDGHNLRDIQIWELEGQVTKSIILAPRGTLETTNGAVYLHMEDARRGDVDRGNWSTMDLDKKLEFKQPNPADIKPGLTDMTFSQLQAELHGLEQRFSLPESPDLTREELLGRKHELETNERDLTMPVRVQIQREVAVSFACFGFTLVGIPLGIRAHRRETNIGFALALALVLIYYIFVILSQSLQMHAELAPHLIVWLPNFIFQAVGAVMLWRANRGL